MHGRRTREKKRIKINNQFDWIGDVSKALLWFVFFFFCRVSVCFIQRLLRSSRHVSMCCVVGRFLEVNGIISTVVNGKSHLTFPFNSNVVGNWDVTGWTRKCETFYQTYKKSSSQNEQPKPNSFFAFFFFNFFLFCRWAVENEKKICTFVGGITANTHREEEKKYNRNEFKWKRRVFVRQTIFFSHLLFVQEEGKFQSKEENPID